MTGWTLLLRTFLRSDRWHLLWWSVGLTVLYVSQGASVDGLYTSQADFDKAAAMMETNTGFIAMTGPPRALNTTGGQVFWQSAAFGAVTIGLMSMLLVARHTRHEEETGREELVRAAAVGRHASLVATTATVLLANLVAGALVGGSLAAYGLPVADSVATGVGLTLCGAVFTGVSVLAAQLTSTTRGLYGITGAVVGAAYFLRAIGDVGTPALSWLSPIGWYQAMHPYSGLRWWPALLLVAAAAVTTAVGYRLFLRRDLGSGLMAARPGPGRAGVGLRSGLGLAWRLQRGSVIGWSVGMLLGGLGYGSIGDGAGDMLGDSDLTRNLFAAGADDLVNGFYGFSVIMLALIATAFTLTAVSRPRSQEEAGYAEMLLATGVTRTRWLAGQLAVCLVGTFLVISCAGLGLATGYAMVTGDGSGFERFALPMLAQMAPVLVVLGFAMLLYGVLPRAQAAGWALLGFALVVLMFGEVFRFPEWVRWLSPYEHLALAPAEPFQVAPFLALLALAAALTGLGAFAFGRRDIA